MIGCILSSKRYRRNIMESRLLVVFSVWSMSCVSRAFSLDTGNDINDETNIQIVEHQSPSLDWKWSYRRPNITNDCFDNYTLTYNNVLLLIFGFHLMFWLTNYIPNMVDYIAIRIVLYNPFIYITCSIWCP